MPLHTNNQSRVIRSSGSRDKAFTNLEKLKMAASFVKITEP